MNVLIFGTGSVADLVENELKKGINIIGYLDNSKDKIGKYLKEKKIYEVEFVKKCSYDCIIIASQYIEEMYNQLIELGVDENKILNYFLYKSISDNLFKNKLSEFNQMKKVDVIITGLSYAHSGINAFLNKKVINFALGSQDLYCDKSIVTFILDKYKSKINKNSKCIIALSYYSFQYDLSKSLLKDRVMRYYPYINVCKNNELYYSKIKEAKIAKSLGIKIIYSNIEDKQDKQELNYDIGKIWAERDSNKNYPETVEENKKIFDDYLTLLRMYDIEAIVVVCPTSKYYSKYFDDRVSKEFNSIINQFKNKYNFQYLDYFCSDVFEDSDFLDVSHLNKKGAEKFTNILNEVIAW